MASMGSSPTTPPAPCASWRSSARSRINCLMSTIAPDSSAAPLGVLPYASNEIDRAYRYWRARILITAIIGYALYYFVRANDSVPVTDMQKSLGFTKAQLGFISSVGGVTYGVSKFINGFFGDHANPR